MPVGHADGHRDRHHRALIDIHHALDWRFSQGGLITILVAVLLTALVGMIRGTSTA